MNKEQFLLMKLAEECAEVAQRALKQIQFTGPQIQKGNEVKDGVAPPNKEAGLTNAQRLQGELKDLGLIVDLLCDTKAIDPEFYLDLTDDYQAWKDTKIAKLNKYLVYARSLGQIDGDWTI